MLAYHGDKEIKAKFVNRAKAHRKADEIVQGYGYWKGGKGCAIGCLAHANKNPHQVLEKEAAIPEIISRLAGNIFEGLPAKESKTWPERFASAIKVGTDLSLVWPKFVVFILTSKEHGVLQYAKTDKTRKAIQDVSDLYQRINNGEKIDANKWLEARKNADDAAASSSVDAYAAYAAAYAARWLHYAAASSSVDVYAAYAAAYAARSLHYAALATALVRFLGEAKVPKKKAS